MTGYLFAFVWGGVAATTCLWAFRLMKQTRSLVLLWLSALVELLFLGIILAGNELQDVMKYCAIGVVQSEHMMELLVQGMIAASIILNFAFCVVRAVERKSQHRYEWIFLVLIVALYIAMVAVPLVVVSHYGLSGLAAAVIIAFAIMIAIPSAQIVRYLYLIYLKCAEKDET